MVSSNQFSNKNRFSLLQDPNDDEEQRDNDSTSKDPPPTSASPLVKTGKKKSKKKRKSKKTTEHDEPHDEVPPDVEHESDPQDQPAQIPYRMSPQPNSSSSPPYLQQDDTVEYDSVKDASIVSRTHSFVQETYQSDDTRSSATSTRTRDDYTSSEIVLAKPCSPSHPPHSRTQPLYGVPMVQTTDGNGNTYSASGCTIYAESTIIYAGTSCTVYVDEEATVVPVESENSNVATRSRAPVPVTPPTNTPINSPSKNVNVHWSFEWPDKQGIHEVPRGLAEEQLKNIPPVIQLKTDHAPDASVVVSPARSATSKTSVRVQGSYRELLEQAEKDLEEKMNKRFDATLKRHIKEIESKFFEERKANALIMRRNMEDITLKKMMEYVPGVSREPFYKLVKSFTARYKVDELREEDYIWLSQPPTRIFANEMAHLKADDDHTILLKEKLMEFLRQYGETGEVERYQRFWQFANGHFGVVPR